MPCICRSEWLSIQFICDVGTDRLFKKVRSSAEDGLLNVEALDTELSVDIEFFLEWCSDPVKVLFVSIDLPQLDRSIELFVELKPVARFLCKPSVSECRILLVTGVLGTSMRKEKKKIKPDEFKLGFDCLPLFESALLYRDKGSSLKISSIRLLSIVSNERLNASEA